MLVALSDAGQALGKVKKGRFKGFVRCVRSQQECWVILHGFCPLS